MKPFCCFDLETAPAPGGEARDALDWRLGRIVAAGTARPRITAEGERIELRIVLASDQAPGMSDVPDGVLAVVVPAPDENQLLRRLWLSMPSQVEVLSGFSSRTFDWPWLLGRSAVHGIVPCRRFHLHRYQHWEFVDWADVLAHYDAFPRKGWTLAQYARRFGLRYEPWGEGRQVPEWLEAGDWQSIARHLMYDLLTLYALHQRFAPAFLGDWRF